MSEELLAVSIKTAENTLFEDYVRSLTSVNETGPFDILAFHENFISLVKDYIEVVNPLGKKTRFPISTSGILRVEDNRAAIFLGVELEKV